MNEFALALVFSTILACGTLVWRTLRRSSADPGAGKKTGPRIEPIGDTEERLQRLERAFPEWLMSMEQMSAQAADLLDSAGRKLKLAKLHETRAVARENRAGGSETTEPDQQPARPHLVRTGTVIEPLG